MCALITGASSGIGLELAKLFARDGHNLILVARDAARLRALADELRASCRIQATVLPADLTDPFAVDAIYEQTVCNGLRVDALINNAGFGAFGLFSNDDPVVQQRMLALNVTALTRLTRLYLPPMLAAYRGYILNVASTAGFFPGPLMAVYYASKAYVVSLSEALAEETRGTGVKVSALCPGPTATEFQQRAGMGRSKLFASGVMDAEPVALAGYRGMLRGKVLIIPGWKNKFFYEAKRFLPRAVVPRLVRIVQEARPSR